MAKAFLNLLFFLLLGISFTSCSMLNGTAKSELSDGIYQFKAGDGKARKIYLQVEEDSLVIFPLEQGKSTSAETAQPLVLEEKEERKKGRRDYLVFRQPSFDVDVLTILFKYRPSQEGGPRQLNTDFNAALYVGYRADSYTLSYQRTPINTYTRNTNHLGLSAGIFTGLGSTMVAPWFTNDQVQIEYDGLVFINGIAANIAYNEFTFGLGVGFDYLMDSNRRYWVYQGKPWVGFTLGLNLN